MTGYLTYQALLILFLTWTLLHSARHLKQYA